ncbi:4-hydroxy-3-methylbut-2-enyl diphosphate reductase [Amycolatopsis speibonae]|uniref:4-hydroxy-3-methylbut-2-enyl diphosphate reductase n=1 Tax=Amycolatopsis speibonae TaxID=1450224 RepID=A0ABV7PD83_9PSEU
MAVVSAGSACVFAELLTEFDIHAAAVFQVQPADGATPVLVAAQVETSEWRMPCPAAPLLAGELRRRGVPAQVVRVATPEVAASGESRGSGDDRPEVVADPKDVALFRAAAETVSAVAFLHMPKQEWSAFGLPGKAANVRQALRSWGAAAGARRVLLAGPRSFCAGVERAIKIVERALASYGSPLYVRKQIVHNIHIVRDLERRGVVFVDELDEVPRGAAVVFSAHGVSPAVRQAALVRELRVVDATCPLVTKVHIEAKRFARRGDTVVLIGHAGHEETEGTLGQVPDRMVLVESEEDVDRLSIDGPVSYLTQTTLAEDEVKGVIDALRHRFPLLRGPGSADICYATSNRQDAVRAIAADSDLVLVVGSVNSSNSQRLVEVARRCGTEAHLIDDVSDLDPAWLVGARTVGLTAGASAPAKLVTEVVDALRGLGDVVVEERHTAEETVEFGLPRELRQALAADPPASNGYPHEVIQP